MKFVSKALSSSASVFVSMAVLSGCALNMQVPVTAPTPSAISYPNGASLKPISLAFKNEQADADKATILTGTVPMHVMYDGKPIEGVSWIAEQTVKEMVARGLPVTLAANGANGTNIVVKRVHIENYRANGFSPFITFTSLRADVDTPEGPQRVTAYVKRGKVPVWTFDEIIEPTFNAPLSLLTKELAAKLNQQFFKQVVSNDQVNALIEKINMDGATRADAYLDVYQLGFSNNATAIPALIKLADSPSEYIRLAALSSLGILKAHGQLNFLIERFESATGIWQDRAMALKAIGDLNTQASRAYLQKQQERFAKGTDKETRWNKEIIELYL